MTKGLTAALKRGGPWGRGKNRWYRDCGERTPCWRFSFKTSVFFSFYWSLFGLATFLKSLLLKGFLQTFSILQLRWSLFGLGTCWRAFCWRDSFKPSVRSCLDTHVMYSRICTSHVLRRLICLRRLVAMASPYRSCIAAHFDRMC